MDNFNEVYPMILEDFQRGSTQQETFERICRERNLNSSLPAVNWIDLFQTSTSEKALVDFRRRLMCIIAGQYLKYRNAMFNQIGWNQNNIGKMLNGRTLFVIQRNLRSITLIDTFNGDSKNLQTDFQPPAALQILRAVLISHDRILIGATRNVGANAGINVGFNFGLNVGVTSGYYLYLLKVDFDSLTYSLLDEVTCNFAFDEMLLDSEDNTKFVLFDLVTSSMVKMQLVDDHIRVELPQQIGGALGARLFDWKLAGDKLFAFRINQNGPINPNGNNGLEWRFMEYNILANPVQTVNEWPSVQCPICQSVVPHDISAYIWGKSKLFVACDSWSEVAFSIAVFDTESFTWSKTNFTGSGDVKSLELDEDYVLTVNAIQHKGNNQWDKTTYRLPMQKPNKLQYLAWATIRRGSMFFQSDTFEKFFPCLPYNSEFRAFAEY